MLKIVVIPVGKGGGGYEQVKPWWSDTVLFSHCEWIHMQLWDYTNVFLYIHWAFQNKPFLIAKENNFKLYLKRLFPEMKKYYIINTIIHMVLDEGKMVLVTEKILNIPYVSWEDT